VRAFSGVVASCLLSVDSKPGPLQTEGSGTQMRAPGRLRRATRASAKTRKHSVCPQFSRLSPIFPVFPGVLEKAVVHVGYRVVVLLGGPEAELWRCRVSRPALTSQRIKKQSTT